MDRIPQSVAKRVVLKAYLASDHFSPATGKTIVIVISKNGGAFANPSAGATNATEIANGWYYVDLSTTDTGTAGPLVVRGTVATVDDVEFIFEVANAFNAGFTGVPGVAAEGAGGLYTRGTGAGQINQAANGMIDTNPVRLNNVSQSLLDLKDFADDGYDPATNKVEGVKLADTLTTYTSNTPQTGDSFARIGAAGAGLTALGDTRIANLDATVSSRLAPAGTLATVTTVTNRVTANTDQIEGADATTYFDGLMTALVVSIWAAGTRTLTSFGTLVADVATAVWAAVTRSLTDKADFTLTAAYDPAKTAAQAGDAMTLTAGERTSIGTAVWASATRTLTSFGTLVADTATAVWAAAARTLTAFGFSGAIADAVWDEPLAGHTTSGSTGEALSDAVTGSAPTATENADALLERNLAGGSNGGRTVRDALRPSRNKVSISGSTVTVFEEDDTTPAWTGALTTNPAASPITAVDPV